MRREFSTYLDLVRFLAAIAVFAAHITFPQFTGGYFVYQGKLAAEGVAAFFVLSGYVIAYVASEKEHSIENYAVSRLARVFSVAIPALALTILIDLLAMHYGWERNVPIYQYHSFAKYLCLTLTFSNQLWSLHESAFGGHPFWSLDYEVWYYIAFGCLIYFNSPKKYLFIGAILLLMWPRPLIDLPMWMFGAGIYYLHKRLRLERLPLASIIFFGCLALLVAYRISDLDTVIDQQVNSTLHGWPVSVLENSQEFASMYLAAGFVGLSIFAARYMRLSALRSSAVAGPIVWLASFTFTLYLTQLNFLDLFANAFPYNPHSPIDVGILVVATLCSVWLLGQITEHKKLWWRALFKSIFATAKQRFRLA